jgi:hypothetical protein
MTEQMTAQKRYESLTTDREPYLQRARKASAVTIPSVMPAEGTNGATTFKTPFQSLGARGVNSLVSKILFVLFPPNQNFFRLEVDPKARREMQEDPEFNGEIEKALSQIEQDAKLFTEARAFRVGGQELVRHLTVTGNYLVYLPQDGETGMRGFPLDRYVVVRDPNGTFLETVIKEKADFQTLSEAQQAALNTANKAPKGDAQAGERNKDLFTHVKFDRNVYRVYQEIDGVRLPGTDGFFVKEKCPYLPLRMNRVDGESYGRGYVEDYQGDLSTLEALSQAITEAAAAAAKVIPLVNPNGVTDERDLAKAENFDFITGVADDVSFVNLDKYPDFQVVLQTIRDIAGRLEEAFLMHGAVQRQAERVTAEEIRFMARELENTLGGVYSILSQEFQLPLATILLAQLQKAGKVPPLPKGLVFPTIITGLEALGRGHDLDKLDALVLPIRELLGPEGFMREVNVGEYLKRRAAALAVLTEGLLYTPEEKQAAREAEMQQQMMMQGLGPAINQVGGIAQKGMENG